MSSVKGHSSKVLAKRNTGLRCEKLQSLVDVMSGHVRTAREDDDVQDVLREMADGLLADHEALARQWQALRAVLRAVVDHQPARLEAAAVQAFAEHYRAHIALEEGELFPMAERWLSAQTLEAIGRTMRRRRGEG